MTTLLIVEDDRKTNDAICEYLKSSGHKVISAYDGGEALQLFRENGIDLVVPDIMLPHVSGLSILHEIRRTSKAPVLKLLRTNIPKSEVLTSKLMIIRQSPFPWYCWGDGLPPFCGGAGRFHYPKL